MGLVYSKEDSDNLIQALSKNLSSATETINELKNGCQQVTAAVDGQTLSGVAYTAGK